MGQFSCKTTSPAEDLQTSGKMTLASDIACLQQKEAAAIADVPGPVLKEYFLQDQQLSHVPRIKTLTAPKIQTPAFALLLTGRMRGC